MFCSTIIPTVNRPTLAKAVNSVLDQKFEHDDFEVIVVNDSGQPLPEVDWQKSPRVRIINTNQHHLSVARNTGAAIAKGRYLHFLDDDDWLLPGALEEFWILAQRSSDAAWLYGTVEFRDGNGKQLGELNLGMSGNCYIQAMAGSWIPVQASLVETKAFFKVGGFHPLFTVAQETELLRRITLRGDLFNTSIVVACMLRGVEWGSTTPYKNAPEYNRWSRDMALSEPGAFSQMWASANSSYWQGRIFRTYLTSILWNWRRRTFFTAASRAMFCAFSLILAGPHLLRKEYWRAVKDSQVPCTQARVLGL